MKRFVYPAIFVKDIEEDIYKVYFPDLELMTDGAFAEEAFLYAKEALKAYFVYVEKFELDFNYPSEFEPIKNSLRANELAMLIQAEVTSEDLKKDTVF